MSDKKKKRAFVLEHQGHRVPATSSKKILHKVSQNKPQGLVQHTSKNTQNKPWLHAAKNRLEKKEISQLAKQDK